MCLFDRHDTPIHPTHFSAVRALALVLAFAALPVFAADSAAATAGAKKAADFLIKQQNENGTFGKGRESGMPGVTGLAVMGLAHSPDKLREGNSPQVKKAVAYILASQQPNGSLSAGQGPENYNTSFGALALAAMENPAYKEPLAKAQALIQSCQVGGDKSGANFGGFGYSPNTNTADLSNTCYALAALTALGTPVTADTWTNALIFVRRCQDNAETNDLATMKTGKSSGGFVYKPGTEEFVEKDGKKVKFIPQGYGSMTYEGAALLALSKNPANDPALQAAKKWIKSNFSVDTHAGARDLGGKMTDKSGYFYYAYGMAHYMATSGEKTVELADGSKVEWAPALAKHLLSLQKEDGSFSNTDPMYMESSSIIATAFALNTLNICLKSMQ